MTRATAAILLLAVLILPALAQAQAKPQEPAQGKPQEQAQPQAEKAAAAPQDIIFSGKLYCSPKYDVIIPFASTVTQVKVALGQKVKFEEVLAVYEIPFEERIVEKKKLALSLIKDLEAKLAQTNRELEVLRARRKELETLRGQQMASDQSLKVNAEEIEVAEKQKAATTEALALERDLHVINQDMARYRLGVANAQAKDVPKHGIIRAPIDGYVLWMNPELRNDAYLLKNANLFQIGAMDPIVLRALVHEIEAQKLREGDEAQVTFESLPGKKFKATVSRIPWAPLAATLQQPSYYEVELTLPNPDLTLKEGLKGQVLVLPRKKP